MNPIALILIIFLAFFLNGCGNDSLDSRVYTQGLGISAENGLTLTFQRFEDDTSHTVHAENLSSALQKQEAQNGGEIFTGHTELLCVDRSHTMEYVQELFYQQMISPECKVIFTDPEKFLQDFDCTEIVHTIRMAEENGILPLTDLSTVLNEWMGMGATALVPVPSGNLPALLLLHKDGNAFTLSDEATEGMYWLRDSGTKIVSCNGKDVSVEIVRLRRKLQGSTLHYHLTVRISENVPEVENIILSQCRTAIQEMRSVNADVIGIQEVIQSAHLESVPEIAVNLHVITGKELLP